MAHINTYDPVYVAARTRERMRRLSRRSFEFERRRRGIPIFSLTALLLAGLLFYSDLIRLNAEVTPGTPADYATKN